MSFSNFDASLRFLIVAFVLQHMLPAFSKLEELNMSKNKIAAIPDSIHTDLDKAPAVIENLVRLNLSKNKFTVIPPILFRLRTSFFSVLFRICEFLSVFLSRAPGIPVSSSIPVMHLCRWDFRSPFIGCNLENLRVLNLAKNDIVIVPDGFLGFYCLGASFPSF